MIEFEIRYGDIRKRYGFMGGYDKEAATRAATRQVPREILERGLSYDDYSIVHPEWLTIDHNVVLKLIEKLKAKHENPHH